MGFKQTDMRGIPLDLNMAADPARRRAVVGGLDFDAAIQVHGALAVLVIAERFDRQRKQRWTLFSEHRCDLPLGSSMNARVGPVRFPAIQIDLRIFQALEAQPFERRLLRMTDAGFDFTFAESHRMQVVWDPRQADSASPIPFIRFVGPSTNW